MVSHPRADLGKHGLTCAAVIIYPQAPQRTENITYLFVSSKTNHNIAMYNYERTHNRFLHKSYFRNFINTSCTPLLLIRLPTKRELKNK